MVVYDVLSSVGLVWLNTWSYLITSCIIIATCVYFALSTSLRGRKDSGGSVSPPPLSFFEGLENVPKIGDATMLAPGAVEGSLSLSLSLF